MFLNSFSYHVGDGNWNDTPASGGNVRTKRCKILQNPAKNIKKMYIFRTCFIRSQQRERIKCRVLHRLAFILFWRWKLKWHTGQQRKCEYKAIQNSAKIININISRIRPRQLPGGNLPPAPPYNGAADATQPSQGNGKRLKVVYNGGADGTRPSRGNGKILKVVYNIIVSKWDVSISIDSGKKVCSNAGKKIHFCFDLSGLLG